MSDISVLSETRCLELLSGEEVGRVALCTQDGPQIFPVKFTLADGCVVFRTTAYSVLGTHAWQSRLAFEVDRIDTAQRSGWSVVASGPGSQVRPGPELEEIVRTWNPDPWAGGTRPLYVRLRWDTLSGRRIGPE